MKRMVFWVVFAIGVILLALLVVWGILLSRHPG